MRRSSAGPTLALAILFLVAACNGAPNGPALTDPRAIVTAAQTSTEAATSVHLDVTVDGSASIALPIGGGTGTSVDLTGTTASADVDLGRSAAHATFSVPTLLNLGGEIVAVDGMAYLKTTLTGARWQRTTSRTLPVDPTNTRALIGDLSGLLLRPGVTLVKGDDIACGSKSCYTVSADLTAVTLGSTAAGSLAGLPVDLAGATLTVTLRVERDFPYHLAGLTAVITGLKTGPVSIGVTASKWDAPVTVTAPPADQVKPS